MKASIVWILILAGASTLNAQGFLWFSNYGGGVDAPITNAAGSLISGASPYVADLFWSTNLSASFDNLAGAGFDQPFAGAGYFVSGSKQFIASPIRGQVRVWDTTYGSTYYQARDAGGEFGFSNFITITPSVAPGSPTPLLGLQGFQLQRLARVMSAVTTTNTIVLSWPVEQTSYVVQQSASLAPTDWITLPNTPVTVGQQQ